MKLSEIKRILVEHGILLTKSLGQNFLHDANQLRRIIRLADLHRSDQVLEIGPGLGPLTELLIKQAGEVLAIEKDKRLAWLLADRLAAANDTIEKTEAKLCIIQDDALEYLRRSPLDWRGWKLVSNLPYSVASPILVELAWNRSAPERMVATLQLEVAKRLMAKPGEPEYGVLSLLMQLHYRPLDWFKIPASCFFPAPAVDSACVGLGRRPHSLLPRDQQQTFASIVKRSFSQRRKMMVKLLKSDWPASTLEGVFAELSLEPQSRAESVSLDQFVSLSRCLHERRNL